MPLSIELNKICTKPKKRLTSLKVHKVSDDILKLLLNPPKTDKYYKESHKKIMDDYIKLGGGHGRNITFILHKAIKNLYYFRTYPQLYANNLELFSIPLLSAIMFDIRQFNMNKLYKLGKLPAVFNKHHPSSNGRYKLYKPMTNKCTIILSMMIIDLLDSYVDKYSDLLRLD